MPQTKRATVYFKPQLHKALKLKAAATDQPLSDLVNRAVQLSLTEDAFDLETLEKRRKEPSRSFETFLKELKRDGLL